MIATPLAHPVASAGVRTTATNPGPLARSRSARPRGVSMRILTPMPRFEPRTKWGRDLADRGAAFDRRVSESIDSAPPWVVSTFGLLSGAYVVIRQAWWPVELIAVAGSAMCAVALLRDLLRQRRRREAEADR